MVKSLIANAGDIRHQLDPWVGKIPWKRAWQSTPVFLPGESRGQRSLVYYIVHGVKKSGTRLREISTQAHRSGVGWERGRRGLFLLW